MEQRAVSDAATALTSAEEHVAIRTEAGEPADLSTWGDAGRRVRAGFLRSLLLGLPLEPETDGGGARIWSVQAPGVRLTGAIVTGKVSLNDCAGRGGTALPGLTLENCHLTD
jgi:hypothetical protein